MIKKVMLVGLLGALSAVAFADNSVQATDSMNQTDSSATISVLPQYTIKAGSHTAAENAAHKQYCSQLGDKDVTDNADIQVGYGNDDPMNSTIICMGNGNPSGQNKSIVMAGPVGSTSQNVPQNVGTSTVTASPINGNVPIDASWWIQAYATYDYNMGGGASVLVQGFLNNTDCIAKAQEPISSQSGHIIARTTCTPIYTARVLPTTDAAYIYGPHPSSNSATGYINFY